MTSSARLMIGGRLKQVRKPTIHGVFELHRVETAGGSDDLLGQGDGIFKAAIAVGQSKKRLAHDLGEDRFQRCGTIFKRLNPDAPVFVHPNLSLLSVEQLSRVEASAAPSTPGVRGGGLRLEEGSGWEPCDDCAWPECGVAQLCARVWDDVVDQDPDPLPDFDLAVRRQTGSAERPAGAALAPHSAGGASSFVRAELR